MVRRLEHTRLFKRDGGLQRALRTMDKHMESIGKGR